MTVPAHRDPKIVNINCFEKPIRPSLEEIYAALDAAGAADFNLERDFSPPVDWRNDLSN